MKTTQVSGLAAVLFLFTLTSCLDNTEPDMDSGEVSSTPVENGKKTVIQDLCWSPDGRTIYFSAMKVKPDFSDYSPGLWTVYRFDLNTQKTEVLVKSALNASVSPSGNQLAVAKNVDKSRHIYLLDKNGGNPIALVTGDAKVSSPSWSPDGKQIAFVGTMQGAEEIYTVHVNGSGLTRLTDSEGHKAYNPAWSPDGLHIAYYLEKGDSQDQIHIIKTDGKKDRDMTHDTFNNIFPGWIDGRTIIYGQSQKDAPTKAFQIDIDGSNKRQVLQLESMYARYSPDGAKIAYINERKGIIEMVSSTGERLLRITVPD